jgi:peptidoglycan/LPS O-acetylase OafA/YrhL
LTSTTNPKTPDNGIDRRKLPLAALASIVAAVAANLVALFIARQFVELPAGFPPLTAGAITFFTVVGTGLGALVFWWLSRRSATPVRTYIIVAVVALILSVIPNFLAAGNPAMFPFPGGTAGAFYLLAVFHVIAALVSVAVLVRLARR